MAEADPTHWHCVLAHPLNASPYNRIRFKRFDGQSTAIYEVEGHAGESGAYEALARAFAKYGAECFHCGKRMPASNSMDQASRDHIHPKAKGGSERLHNLVLAHKKCNQNKAALPLAKFNPDAGDKYLRALDEHISRCIETLRSQD
jgi:5-methylcytosine-specific restriction endonuclease McrA